MQGCTGVSGSQRKCYMFSILKKITTSRCDRINQLLLLPSLIQTPKRNTRTKEEFTGCGFMGNYRVFFQLAAPFPSEPKKLHQDWEQTRPRRRSHVEHQFPSTVFSSLCLPSSQAGTVMVHRHHRWRDRHRYISTTRRKQTIT